MTFTTREIVPISQGVAHVNVGYQAVYTDATPVSLVSCARTTTLFALAWTNRCVSGEEVADERHPTMSGILVES